MASATTENPGTSCPDQTEADDCCCFEVLDEGLAAYCMPEPICGVLSGECVDKQTVDCSVEEGEAATVDCLISGLQANQPGTFNVGMNPAMPPFDWSYDIRLYTSGDGSVFWLGYLSDDDFSTHYEGVKRFEITALGLDACAALATADARFHCLRAAFVDGAPVETCIEPFVN